jgi:hypothetical protein
MLKCSRFGHISLNSQGLTRVRRDLGLNALRSFKVAISNHNRGTLMRQL